MSILPERLSTEKGINDIDTSDRNVLNDLGVYPTKTWMMDSSTGRIIGQIDDEDALEQFIVKALKTARNRFLIYDDQYGTEVYDFLGQDVSRALAASEIPRLIVDAISYDDRIKSVKVLSVDIDTDNKLYVHLSVDSVYGERERRYVF